MKKFISIVIAMLMVLSLVPMAMASEAEPTETAEHFMLTYQNFNLPENYTGMSINTTDGKSLGPDYNTITVGGGDLTKKAEGRIWVKAEGKYKVFALWSNGKGNDGRHPKVYVNDACVSDNTTWHEAEKGSTNAVNSAWDEVAEVTLYAGWNTISFGLQTAWKPYFMNAMYVTSDLIETIDTNTDNGKLALYGDITVPEFASNAAVTTEKSDGLFKVTFPQATDEHTLHYSYTVDGETTEIADITQYVDFSNYNGEISVTLTAADAWGNAKDMKFDVTVPELYARILLNCTNFAGYKNKQTDWSGSVLYEKDGFMVQYTNADGYCLPTATFYIPEGGEYNIYVLKWIANDDTNRIPVAVIDGNDADDQKIMFSHVKEPSWEAKEYTFSKGWHTLQFVLNSQWAPYSINAVYITNDLNENITTDNNENLKAYLSGGVGINGAVYDAKGLAEAGVESDCGYINLTPIKPIGAEDEAGVTINGISTTWDTPFKVSLNSLENTVKIDTTADSGDAEFAVINLGTEYTTNEASLSGQKESSYFGADGNRKAYSLEESGSATWQINGVTGKRDVWVYQIGAGNGACASSTAEITASGTTNANNFDNSGTTSGWVKLGTYTFSGTGDESVTVKGSNGGSVYVDSIKLTYADDLLLVSSRAVVTESGSVAFEYKYYNQTDISKSVTIAAAAYSEDALVDVTLTPESAVRGINVFKTKALTGGTAYKGFVFDSINTLVPLAASVGYPAD